MNKSPFIITSGFIGGHPEYDSFYETWLRNLQNNTDCDARHIYVICSRDQSPPLDSEWVTKIKLKGDLGHICRDQSQRHQIEGWPMVVMTGMMLAYQDECDFIHVEQDCLPFGNFVSKMYEEIRDGVGCIMGNLSTQPCAQSLFLVRHWFIPELVHGYLGKKIKEKKLQGEQAFDQMDKEMNGKFQRFSFGFDRDRPPEGLASMKDKTWYLQQISFDEKRQLRELGFIT